MKPVTILLGLALTASVGLNVYFWQQARQQRAAGAFKVTPDLMEKAKDRAQAIACVNNLKQIGLALRLYAADHGKVFPPDLPSMKVELVTPKILFCPNAPASTQATTWAELNPSAISYQYLNPNGKDSDPQQPFTTCPIHGHVGLSDGSVQVGKKKL